ncbi:MAG: hypothetical protein C0393_04330 [Anaerolinea sp.]|nr:hypothetical protein [Anaerolinea sp.]
MIERRQKLPSELDVGILYLKIAATVIFCSSNSQDENGISTDYSDFTDIKVFSAPKAYSVICEICG